MFWEELRVGQFRESIDKTGGVCLFPLGCLEKHGGHLPLGTDIYIAREIAARAAALEEMMIFPSYPLGIVAEVRHKLGTVAVPSALQFQVLEAILDEIARNGYKKIILGNGHGGNSNFLNYFAQAMLEKRKDYTVYVYELWRYTQEQEAELTAKYGPIPPGGHADLIESSDMLAIRPDCVDMSLADREESQPLLRGAWTEEHGVFTGINWYAAYPEQAAGDPTGSSAGFGEDMLNFNAQNLAEAVRAIKADKTLPRLFEEFYKKSAAPEE